MTAAERKRRERLQKLLTEDAERRRRAPVPARFKSQKRYPWGRIKHRYRVGDIIERPGHYPARILFLTSLSNSGYSDDVDPAYWVIDERGIRDTWHEGMNLRLVQRRGKRYARDTRHSYVTDTQLSALEREARLAGDTAMARVAASALRGNVLARRKAATVIAHAHAQRDRRRQHRRPGAPSFKAQAAISRKIRVLRHEGYPERQAIAAAYRMEAPKYARSKRRKRRQTRRK